VAVDSEVGVSAEVEGSAAVDSEEGDSEVVPAHHLDHMAEDQVEDLSVEQVQEEP
jgi:hypothetical protein